MACIILYKGEEIPYAEWVDRLEKGLLDELVSEGTIDIAQFKSGFTPKSEREKLQKIVLDEGDGIIINDLFNEWNSIKSEKDQAKWNEKVKNTKFGTYGTVGLMETIKKFNPKMQEVIKRNFYTEIENALNVPDNQKTYKPYTIEKPITPKPTTQPTSQAEVKNKLIELGISEEEAEVSSRIYDAYVRNKATKTGRTIEDVYGDIEFEGEDGVSGLMQMPNGEIVKTKVINADVVNGFYSPLEKTINETKFDKLPTKQWIDKFAKGEEAKWTGLNEWLGKQQGSVSKADIQQYLKDNRIQVVEVVKSEDLVPIELNWGKKDFDIDDYNATIGSGEEIEYVLEDEEIGYEIIKTDEFFYVRNSRRENIFKDDDYNNEIKSLEEAKRVAGLHLAESNVRSTDGAKFEQYQLEGEKENYKEVLVTMPSRTPNYTPITELPSGYDITFDSRNNTYAVIEENQTSGKSITGRYHNTQEDAVKNAIEVINAQRKNVITGKAFDNQFKSSHFDEPNILVHLRMNTRKDADGNKVLFLEEVQSDWGQEGKKKGFRNEKESEVAGKKALELAKKINDKYPNEVKVEINQDGSNAEVFKKIDGEWKRNVPRFKYSDEQRNEIDVLKENSATVSISRGGGKDTATPTAPFVTDTNAWTKLGLKVALKEAVKQGVDKIAWSTGTQQFDRWGSEEISWRKNTARTPQEEARMKELGEKIVNYKDTNEERVEHEKLARKEGGFSLLINEQTSGATAFNGQESGNKDDVTIQSKEDLRKAIKKNLSRERNDAEIDKLTDRIWNRMQTEDSGTSLPRKEGMEEFYGNPADMERAKNFTIKKEGELFAVKDEKGKTIRTFKQENEANKFKENYGLGIVGNVAKSLFKQEPKTINLTLPPIKGFFEPKEPMIGSTQHSIDITPELKAEVEQGQSLFQKEKSTPKGRITFTDLKSIMAIGKKGDASTFIHELSHHDLQGYIDAAKNGDEKAINSLKAVIRSTYPKISETEVNKKLAEVLKIDRTQENVRGTEYEKIHEHYARGFEKWMKDGDKAGFSAEMVALFEKMKEFLTRIYEGLKLSPIDVQFSPEVEQMYRDMFGVEYEGKKEDLKNLREDIQQDNIDAVGDISMDDVLGGLLQRGLQQDSKPKLTTEESLLKIAEIMFKNFETDEINVVNDVKAKINSLPTTDERKQEILNIITPEFEERLKEEVAFANTNLRQLALKILQSENSTDAMKIQARKDAYYEKMSLQKERDRAEKRWTKAGNIYEQANTLADSVSKDTEIGARLVNDLVSTFERLNAQYEAAKARGDKDMVAKTEGTVFKLLEALFNQSTSAGKTLAAQKVLKFVIPDMYVKWIEKKVQLRNSEEAVKDVKEKLKEALKNVRALESNESWALEVQDKLENKIEKLQDVIVQQNNEIERLQKIKAEVENEAKKPQEKAVTDTATNPSKKGIIAQAKGTEYINKLKEAMLKRAKEKGLMQEIDEMSDMMLLTELATEYIADQINNGKKVSVQNFFKFMEDVHFSETKIDDIINTYKQVKESLKGETSVSNFSNQDQIDEYRDKLLEVKELDGKKREKELTEEELAIKKAEAKAKKDQDRISEAPLSVAKRIVGEAERRNSLRTPKEQDAIKKLKEILFKRAVDRFKEKPFKERVEKSIEEKLADFLNEELLKNGKDWDIEIKKEIDLMIDNAKYSDEDKAKMKEFISDYISDRTETLVTNAVADDVLRELLAEGYPTKDGKVDWHTIIKKNYKNQEGARQYLIEKLGERIGSEKLATDVIGALEKRFAKQATDRKAKYLEAEIRKLEKLKENEKLPQRVNSRIKKLIELDNIGGLDEDIFYSYMAKELGMDALTPEDLKIVKKFVTLIQDTPEGEERNNLMRTLSAFISMRVSPIAFTFKTMVEFKLSNMLGHPITSIVNATAGLSQPIMMLKRLITTRDTNYLKMYLESFNKGVFKAAFQNGYLKSGMNYESAGGDKLATFSNLEEFKKISQYMDSKTAKLINKLFVGGATNVRIPYLVPSLQQFGRFNEGVDSIVRTQAEEMRAYRVIQDKIIRENKKNGVEMSIREVRKQAYEKLYPISTADAITQAQKEFMDKGQEPTDAMVKRRAFEIQQQKRDDDVRELAEKEGLRDTYRTPPKLHADEIEGIFDAINFVFGAITRGFTKPEKGEIGVTAKQVAFQAVKANLVPFVNTVMNILETGSNFVPIYGGAKGILSATRAFTAKERGGLSQDERRAEYKRLAYTQITQNIIGTALSMYLLQLLFDSLNKGLGDDDDEYGIYGSRPYGKRKTNDKITKVPLRNVVHLPFADIPINAFGIFAPYLYYEAAMADMKRSIKVDEMNTKKLDEVTKLYLVKNKPVELAGEWLSTMLKNMPLAAPRAFMDMIGKASSGEGTATARLGDFVGSSVKMQLVPQARMLQDAYEAINPITPEATDFAEGLAKGGGFITQMMFETKPMYDYRGRTIDIKDKHLLTVTGFIRRFGTANESDDVDKFVTKHKLFINPSNTGSDRDEYQQKTDNLWEHKPFDNDQTYKDYKEINTLFNNTLDRHDNLLKFKKTEDFTYKDENGDVQRDKVELVNKKWLDAYYTEKYEEYKKLKMSELSAKAYADRDVQKVYSEMYNGIERRYFLKEKKAVKNTKSEYLRILKASDM